MNPSALPLEEWLVRIAHASTLEELDMLELDYLGRKRGVLTAALKELGALDPDARKIRGAELNEVKLRVEDALSVRRSELSAHVRDSLAKSDRIDVTLELPPQDVGSLHPVPQFLEEMEEVFGRMGFDIARGTEVEHEDFNFTLINIPPEHPARDMQATFWVEGDEPHVLRTHTTPVQIHYMRTHTPPFRMICPGTVYRKDYDATHSPMFHQCEGLMVDDRVSLTDMQGVMVEAMKALLHPDIEFRFRTSYFPFVEPGLEVDIRMKNQDGSPGRWLEVVGCGMVHPQVLKNGGIDPKTYRGFAFGFGIERLVMIKRGITDLRAFYEGDMRWLRQFSAA